MHGSQTIVETLQMVAAQERRDATEYFVAARRTATAMPVARSIDNFLNDHRADKRIEIAGKLAIVETILEAERGTSLFADHARIDLIPNLEALRGRWFTRFWHVFTEDCPPEALPERSTTVAFIVFNYDRCLEQFLYAAMRHYYGFTFDRAAEAVNRISIYHPYGSVGWLPWQGKSPATHFGGKAVREDLINVARQIKTFTEGVDENASDILDIRRVLREARRVVFLGFAYHTQNMRLLWPAQATDQERQQEGKRAFGTALNLSDSDARIIAQEINHFGGIGAGTILRNNLTCGDLFTEYSRSLSLLSP